MTQPPLRFGLIGAGRIGTYHATTLPSGRCEPGTGEISYPAVARALADMGCAGTVGHRGRASGDSEAALTRFREAFTL
jgi:hydroxypyruvate isomerase